MGRVFIAALEVVVANNSRYSAGGGIAKVGLGSRLVSARPPENGPNKLPKSAIMGGSGNLFGNQFKITRDLVVGGARASENLRRKSADGIARPDGRNQRGEPRMTRIARIGRAIRVISEIRGLPNAQERANGTSIYRCALRMHCVAFQVRESFEIEMSKSERAG